MRKCCKRDDPHPRPPHPHHYYMVHNGHLFYFLLQDCLLFPLACSSHCFSGDESTLKTGGIGWQNQKYTGLHCQWNFRMATAKSSSSESHILPNCHNLHIWIAHTAPESVKRVKSGKQILVKSFFWRLNAPNPLGGSSGHQRTPLLNACQKWSPLMTGATSKCICGVQPPEKWLNHYFCLLLFTCPEQCAAAADMGHTQ